MTKHFFFDLDKTLTRSRTPMASEHQELFGRLCDSYDVVVVSGAQESQMRYQVTPRFDGRYWALTQRGNHAIAKDGSVLWKEDFTDAQVAAIFGFIKMIEEELKLEVSDKNDLVEHRGSQVGYSLIGHHEDVEKKYAFDPKSELRKELLSRHRVDVERLHAAGIDVEPGGTTSLDFMLAGQHKGFNITRFLKHTGWSKDECIYVGDELEPGRNDESVIGVIPTHAVTDPDDTFAYIASVLV
jgi:HAD superfamily hydrolase (TIGR01484 family)